MAAVCLNNFRIMEKEDIDEFIQPEGNTRRNNRVQLNSISEPLLPEHSSSIQSQHVRNQLAEYFISGGSVYWQDGMIR